MPYINKDKRTELDGSIAKLVRILNEIEDNDEVAGCLNYTMSRLIWELSGHKGKGQQRYARMNMVIGAIEAAKLEYYRRIVSPYEDHKIFAEGDI